MRIFQKIRAWDNRFSSAMDLKRKFPGYFSKTVFRLAVLLLVVVALIAAHQSGWKLNTVHLECPESVTVCENPYYVCGTDPGEGINFQIPFQGIGSPECQKSVQSWICEQIPCNRKYLYGGESYGTKAPFLIQHFKIIALLVLVGAFAINHILYRRTR